MKPPDLPEHVPAKQAAQELGIPYSTLRTAHFNGELPALRIGKENSRRESWYFRRADLLQWLERHTHQVKPQPRGSNLHVQRKTQGVA